MAKKKKLLNPQQEEFIDFYTDPKSPTFSNAYESALKAKYAKKYAENITTLMPSWLGENIGDMRLLNKAIKNLDNTFDLKTVNEEGKIDSSVLGIQSTNARFIASTIGKKRFSTRSNLLDDEGKAIPIPILPFVPIDPSNGISPNNGNS